MINIPVAAVITRLNANTLQRNIGEKRFVKDMVDVTMLIYPHTVGNETLNQGEELDLD